MPPKTGRQGIQHLTSLPPSSSQGPSGLQQKREQRERSPLLWSVAVSGEGREWARRGTWGQGHSEPSLNDRPGVEREAQRPCEDRPALKANFMSSKKAPSAKKHAPSPAYSPGITILLPEQYCHKGFPRPRQDRGPPAQRGVLPGGGRPSLALDRLLVLGPQSSWRAPVALGTGGGSQLGTLPGFLLMRNETSEAAAHTDGP